MPFCLIGLGSNQGNRQQLLEAAIACVAGQPGVRVVRQSSWRETSPIGGPAGQPLFLNGAIVVETSLAPEQLLESLLQVEQALGRQRKVRWGERTIDLDLLIYDDVVLNTPSLQLPHPRMAWRRFVLEPAAEVAPEMIHPTTGWTISHLLLHLNASPWYVAIAGPIAVGKSCFAHRLADLLNARRIDERPNWPHLTAFYSNPTSHAWAMELEFLEDRARLLADAMPPDDALGSRSQPSATGMPESSAGVAAVCRRNWAVSDFWFDQSLAFGRAWLAAERLPLLAERWRSLRPQVPTPKLVVLLDAPAATLASRLHARGRTCEKQLTEEQLERIRQALMEEVGRPDVGPVLRLTNEDPDAAVAEVLTAVRGME